MAENSKPEMMFLMLEEMGLVVVVMSKVKGLVVVMVMVLFVAMIVMGGRIRSVDGNGVKMFNDEQGATAD